LYLCLGVSIFGTLALLFPDPWLNATGVPETLQDDVRDYLYVLALAVGPSLLFRMYSTLNQSLGMPLWVTILQIAALGLKIPLSIYLTLGGWGLEAQGVVGCAWATLIVNTWLMLMGLYFLRSQKVYQEFKIWQSIEAPDWKMLKEFLRLGVPAALSVLVEVTAFTMMALFISRQGVVASASHQIATSIATLLYMIPLALGIACSARVGFWIGANDAGQAEKAAHTGLKLTLMLALLFSTALALSKETLAGWFSADTAVSLAASAVLGWEAIYHLVDALQAVCAFILRCYRMTLLPLIIYSNMLWGVGLWGAFVWAYECIGPLTARPEVTTFWAAASFALCIVSLAFITLVLWVAKQRRL
jgi:MATE family multidrug resistance protein